MEWLNVRIGDLALVNVRDRLPMGTDIFQTIAFILQIDEGQIRTVEYHPSMKCRIVEFWGDPIKYYREDVLKWAYEHLLIIGV